MIAITYIDHDGVETLCMCRTEHHAMALEASLTAEGLQHERGTGRCRTTRVEARGWPVREG